MFTIYTLDRGRLILIRVRLKAIEAVGLVGIVRRSVWTIVEFFFQLGRPDIWWPASPAFSLSLDLEFNLFGAAFPAQFAQVRLESRLQQTGWIVLLQHLHEILNVICGQFESFYFGQLGVLRYLRYTISQIGKGVVDRLGAASLFLIGRDALLGLFNHHHVIGDFV